MRLIDADALINNLEMLIEEQEEDDHVETWNNAITCAINEVKHHAPTVEPPKGRWIDGWRSRLDGARYWYRACSECGYERDDDDAEKDTNYCLTAEQICEKGKIIMTMRGPLNSWNTTCYMSRHSIQMMAVCNAERKES